MLIVTSVSAISFKLAIVKILKSLVAVGTVFSFEVVALFNVAPKIFATAVSLFDNAIMAV